jgi:nitroreductase
MNVSQTLRSRVSIRAFTDRCPSAETVRKILDAARWSPSGSNMQPWKVIALAGQARADVCDLARRVLAANPDGEEGDYPVCPAELPPPMAINAFRSTREPVTNFATFQGFME